MIDRSPRGSWAYVLSQFPWVQTSKDTFKNSAHHEQSAGLPKNPSPDTEAPQPDPE